MEIKSLEVNDIFLIQRYKNGDSEAFGIIFKKYKNNLHGYILKIVKDSDLADDILQDVFIKALESINIGRYNEKGVFKAYIYSIAHNESVSFLRKKSRTNILSLNIPKERENIKDKLYFILTDFSENPEEKIINLENKYNIQSLINKLPRLEKEVVVLKYYFNLSFNEIAKNMNCPNSTNRVRMIRAISNLRKKINKIKNGNNLY